MLRLQDCSQALARGFCALVVLFMLFGCAAIEPTTSQNTGSKTSKPSGRQSVRLLENATNDSMLHQSSVESTLLSPELLRLDLAQLVKRVNEIHPEPFEIIDEREFRDKAALIELSLRFPLTRREFYLRVAPLITELRDIHSRIDLPRNFQGGRGIQSGNVRADPTLFPLAVLYEESGLLVAADLTNNPTIPVGAILVDINGAPVEYLLSVMKKLTSYETETGWRRKIQVSFPWLLVAMGYGNDTYEISYQWQGLRVTKRVEGVTPAGNLKEIEQPAQEQALTQSRKTKEANNNQESAQSKSPPSFYGFNQLSQQTALLWFNDFNERPPIFSEFLKRHFRQFETNGLSNLIIDLRYNDGGLTQNIRSLLSFLISEPIYWNRIGEIKISEPLRTLHQQRTKQRRKSKYHWGLQWLPLEWTDFLQYEISWSEAGETVDVEFEPVDPSRLSVPVNITLLTNGYCFSACSALVAVINKENLGVTMGEAPGNFVRVQYGYPINTKLTYSQLELTLPTMKLMFEKDQRDRKRAMNLSKSLVSPQIGQTRSQRDIENRVDSLLNRALLEIEN